ncbi:MAG: serine/threonine-protein kinase [Oscillospiraceae bacterium]
MSDKTRINPALSAGTEINPALSGGMTAVNPALSAAVDIAAGTTLPGGYVINRRLNAPAGEADIYICERDGCEYVAKIYRRAIAVKSEVIAALQEVHCPYVAPLYRSDVFGGLPFEILPYYRNGSLLGRRFSFEELKRRIIPELNEALAALHDVGVIHKDLKPSNIMLTDSGDIAIIDFGISSVQSSGSTVVVTSTGMTPEYSAPETFRKLFLEESDYYSLGITLYELFCGKTPYTDMSAEEIARYTAIQRIPLPEDMPKPLKDLISALTYYDITNRRRKSNPNRRWTYDEVQNWCADIPQPVPGEGAEPVQRAFPVYTFMNRRLTSLHEVVSEFTLNWEQGKKDVFRGILSGFLKPYDPQLAGYVLDAEEEAAAGGDPDIAFFKLIYRLDPDTKAFCWKNRRFESIPKLGEYILNCMNSGDMSDEFVNELLSRKLISAYVGAACPGDSALAEAARSLEDLTRYGGQEERSLELARYMVGFVLAGEKRLTVGEKSFASPDELVKHMKSLLAQDIREFERVCGEIISPSGQLSPQFEAWLISLGKRGEVEQWKSQNA